MGKDQPSVWILGNQLLAEHPALAGAENCRVVMVESRARLAARPYQRKKLVLLLSAMRHYAQELREQGYTVDYVQADTFGEGLRSHVRRYGATRLVTMAATCYGGRRFQQSRLQGLLDVPVEALPNTQMLCARYAPYPLGDLDGAPGQSQSKQVVMEHFYRAMRRHFGVLITQEGEPEGGAWNFDKENRKPYPKDGVVAPAPVRFAPDAVTREVMAQVAALPNGIGPVDGFGLATTRAEAETAAQDFLAGRLAGFGPLEDAMSRGHAYLFHSGLSGYLNLGLLDPLDLVRRAEAAYRHGHAPIHSVEGFVRQILGWREYIYWQYWRQMPGLPAANAWGHARPLPDFFWSGDVEMACLRHVLKRVLDEGYSHHIERLMVLCNYAMLAKIAPHEVHEWFMSCYVDAYEWVVAPNVLGMGLNADHGKTATKPYIASANYINKMSDYCGACSFDPRLRTGARACPFNFLYWNFLLENEEKLRKNPRLGPAVLGLRRLDAAERDAVRTQARAYAAALD